MTEPAYRIERGKLSDVTQDPQNANLHTARGAGVVEKSLRRGKFFRPTAAFGKGVEHPVMGAGNLTQETLISIGVDDALFVYTDGSLPIVHVRTDVAPGSKEAQRLALEDNRSAELSLDWSIPVLTSFDADILEGLWTPVELSDLGQMWADEQRGAQEEPGAQIDKAEELQAKWQTASGQMWQLGAHRLICGDCTAAATVARVMQGEKAALLLTSPPYGVGMEYEKGNGFDETVSLAVAGLLTGAAHISDNGFAFVNFGERWTFPKMVGQAYIEAFQSAGWRWYDFRYWKRDSVAMAIWNTTQPHAMSDMDSLFTFQNGKGGYPVRNLDISKQSLWVADGSSSGMGHPAVMAIGIAENAVGIYTDKQDAVYEPFAGSGTTLIACERLGRKCRAVEISAPYCAVALQRWADMTGKTPILAQDNT